MSNKDTNRMNCKQPVFLRQKVVKAIIGIPTVYDKSFLLYLMIRAVSSLGDWKILLELTISTNKAPTHAVIPFSYVNSESDDGTKSFSSILVGEFKIDSMVSFDFL